MRLGALKFKLIFIQVSILLLEMAIGFTVTGLRLDPENLIYPECVGFSVLCFWTLWSWYTLKRSLFDPYALFLYSAMLFNGGQILLEVLRVNQNGILAGRFPPDIVLSSIYLVIIGLTGLHLGILVSTGGRSPETMQQPHSFSLLPMRIVGWAFTAVAIIPASFLYWEVIRSVIAYGYLVGVFQKGSGAELASSIQILASFLVPGAFLLLVSSRSARFGDRLRWCWYLRSPSPTFFWAAEAPG